MYTYPEQNMYYWLMSLLSLHKKQSGSFARSSIYSCIYIRNMYVLNIYTYVVTVELTPHTNAHDLRATLCFVCLLSTVTVTPTVHWKPIFIFSRLFKSLLPQQLSHCETYHDRPWRATADLVRGRVSSRFSAWLLALSRYAFIIGCLPSGFEGKLESRPTVTRLSLGCLILVRSLI